jgi:hypothetical protein
LSIALATALAVLPQLAQAQAPSLHNYGLATAGSRGGLTIPGARSVPTGDIAIGVSNYQEPAWGSNSVHSNYLLGIGLGGGVELTGRIADYNNPPPPGGFLTTGIRDLSANLKWQLPRVWNWQPDVAVGTMDVGGGAVNFSSSYLVLGDDFGPLSWTFGFGRANSTRSKPYALDGAFGGLEWRFGTSGVSALLEHDSHQAHAGLRYHSEPVAALGQSQWVASLQRSLNGKDVLGVSNDATRFGVTLVMPLGRHAQRDRRVEDVPALPAYAAAQAPGASFSAQDLADRLHTSLIQAGLERVRVGTQGSTWVVEFENTRYLQNEVDALGLVLGLAAEWAPPVIQSIRAVALKTGQAVQTTEAGVADLRAFLRHQALPQGLAVQDASGYDAQAVQWASSVAGSPSARSWARVELGPVINYAVATEVGLFDYSLGVQASTYVPLWRGAEWYTQHVGRVSNSFNYEPGRIYNGSLLREGLKTAAIQQSLWLAPGVLASVGAGRYQFDRDGVQGQLNWNIPGRDDVLRLRGAAYKADPAYPQNTAGSASYRWVPQPNTWVEVGAQQYSDGTQGPSVVFTRWFGDVSVNVFYRRGGVAQFAGVELSFPLAPRKGMGASPVQVAGVSQFQTGLRTRITDSNTNQNLVQFDAVRDTALDYHLDRRQLNAGRSGTLYVNSQLERLREAFYRFGRPLLP